MSEDTEPRYEFRVWGGAGDEAGSRIRSRGSPLAVHTREETYLVALTADRVNAKVRGGVLDVKVLQTVRDGFEQWAVHLKAEFPVTAELLRTELLPLYEGASPPLDAESYSLQEVLTRVVEPHPDVAAVTVRKHRHQLEIGECVAEFTLVEVGAAHMRTVAIESADLEALRATRVALGLAGMENMSYPHALRIVILDRNIV